MNKNIYVTAFETTTRPPAKPYKSLVTAEERAYNDALSMAGKLDMLRERGVAAATDSVRQMTSVAEAFANGTPPTMQTLQHALEVLTLATEFNATMQAWVSLLNIAVGKTIAHRVRDAAIAALGDK